ncbi:MAG: phosphate signaling complex protein PhoU [Deltaproteobacteria bacterium]|nr:MAG: phosphate signaling complex protein PhoU [Deltaproteobacteria bacterium]
MAFSRKQHTDRSYDEELADLRAKLLTLGGKVESEIAESVRALAERDTKLAEAVLGADREVNRLELEIDEKCRRLLVLRQPAASDLRFITTAMKIVVDLERIGDLAVNIAERAIDLNQSPPLRPLHDLTKLCELCQKQLRGALDSFVDADADKAEAVIKDDELVDALYHNLFNELLALMMEDSKNIRRANSLLFVAKHLERLADHATNVAEMVIFMVRGTDVRHPHSRDEV